MEKERSIMASGFAKKLCCGVVSAVMALSLVGAPGVTAKAHTKTVEGQIAEAAISLSNPRIVQDLSYESDYKVTYDCVYFGSYPQAEVVASVADEITVDECIRNGIDYIVDATLYKKLKVATGWDANGDVTIDGERYRRLKSTDATRSYSFWTSFYYWGSAESKGYDEDGYAIGDINSDTYHYFKYQPIKWRVLSVDGKTAFLLADMALDNQQYNTTRENVTWETSTLRSFLNSYDASFNQENIDYSGKGFLDTAFTADETLAIENTTVVNAGNDDNKFDPVEDSNNTIDRVFLISKEEAEGVSSKTYGFASKYGDDEARKVMSSTYAKAMGCESTSINIIFKVPDTYRARSCFWLLRSPGFDSLNVRIVDAGGEIHNIHSVNKSGGILPAIKLDISFSNLLVSAGTYTTTKDSHAHNYEWTVTKKATCNSEGIESYMCSCGGVSDKRTMDKDSSNHAKVVTDKAVAATCTKTGLTAGSHCTACGAVIKARQTVAATGHKAVTDAAVAATCTKAGLTEGSHCSVCKAVIKAQKTVAKKTHTKSGWKTTKKATVKAAGKKTVKCTKCGKTLKTANISKISSVKLSKTKYTYNGKAKKPTVTVKNSAGKVISASNYKVTYKNNKLPGKATVTVTFKGSYSGKVTKTFTINRAKQTITTAKVKTYKASSLKKKAATVKLKAKTNGKGRLTYKVSKYPKNAKKYISVSKNGVVTLKKGAKKGVYKIKITAAKTAKYAKTTKTVTIKVK